MIKYLILLLATSSIYAQTTGIIGVVGTNSGQTPTPEPPDPTTTGIHVTKTGSDANGCTFAAPCLTVQRGSNVATSGDTIFIHAGVYRETITPATNGQTFTNYNGETVHISGLELVGDTGWSLHAGNIYKKSISIGPMFTEQMSGFSIENLVYGNTEMLSQQIFKNDVAQAMASYPKAPSVQTLLTRASYRSSAQGAVLGVSSVNDAGLTAFASLGGATVTANGWFITATRTVLNHNNNSSSMSFSSIYDTKFFKFYRLTNHLNLLTQAGEWYYNGSTLYYWQANGLSPTGLEYKDRNYGFILNSRTGTVIKGLNFIGCDVASTTTASTNTTIDNVRAKYTSHHVLETLGGAHNGSYDGYLVSAVQTGTKLLGSGSVLKNSEFQYGSGVGVWAGDNVTIENNKFDDYAYVGFYQAPVKLAYSHTNGADNVKILHNSFNNTGRGAIELTANDNGCTYNNLEIGYNEFYGYNRLCVDGAPTYAARKTITPNFIFHHNYSKGTGFDEGGTGQQGGIQVGALYFDQASGPAVVAYNISELNASGAGRTGAYSAEFYTQLWWNEINVYATGTSIHYNNTWVTNTGGGNYSYVTYAGKNNTNAGAISYNIFEKQRNMIFRSPYVVNWGESGDVSNSITQGTNPLFTNTGTGKARFQLQSSSPARGIGTTSISGLPAGAPAPGIDAGALQYGVAPFETGYHAVTP